MHLHERDHYLRELGDLLERVASGSGALGLVAGEAGAGKTSLCQAFIRQIDDKIDVYVGYCDPLETPRPLGPLLDIAPDLSSDLDELLADGDQRHRVLRAFLDALSRKRAPMVVILEDMHWADEATLDLLRFVGRRVESTRALLLVTYRDDEVVDQHPLKVVLGDIATSRSVRRINLAPLSEDAVREMAVGSEVDPVALHGRTGGNPFYVTEALAAGEEGIPETVREAVQARAARLSRSARSVLDAAAVIGPVIPIWLLQEVTRADAETLDECLSIGVLAPHRAGLAFRHELGREAILEALTPHRRVALHGAVLEALERSGATVDPPDWAAEPFALQIRGEWQRAADAWRELGCPYETARALAESADEAALREALDIFAGLGARPMTTIVQRRLRRIGVRNIPRGPRSATTSNPAGLTNRELEVLRLLGNGMTNAAIAEHLYLSPRTVEHHVSAVLGKLNAQSRLEAVREARVLGLISEE